MLVCWAQATAAVTWTAGVKSGVNFAEFAGDDNLDEANTRTGFMGGAFAHAAFNEQAGLRIEALWVSKGTDFSDSTPDDSSAELDYVEFPLLFVVDLRPEETAEFNIFLGPTFGFNASAEVVENGAVLDTASYVEDFELGIAIGLGFEYALTSMSIVLDGRSTSGFTHAIQDLTQGNSVEVTNRGIGVMAGVAFSLGGRGR